MTSSSREHTWERRLNYDALTPLIESGIDNISLFSRRDLKGEPLPIQNLWEQREAQSIMACASGVPRV